MKNIAVVVNDAYNISVRNDVLVFVSLARADPGFLNGGSTGQVPGGEEDDA